MNLRLDHLAVLVRSLDRAIASLPEGTSIGAVEEFPSEGTRECYVTAHGTDHAALLLLETIGHGPYQRALERRGPGIHHLAFTLESLNALEEPLTRWGLRLHPHTLQSLPRGTAWACGGGLPFLLELHQRTAPATAPFITGIALPSPPPCAEELAPGLFQCEARGLSLTSATGKIIPAL